MSVSLGFFNGLLSFALLSVHIVIYFSGCQYYCAIKKLLFIRIDIPD